MSAVGLTEILAIVNSMNMMYQVVGTTVLNVASLVVSDIQARQARIQRLLRILQRRRTRRLKRNVWVHVRSGAFWERDVPNLDERQFKEHFRMSRESFAKVVQALGCLERQDTAFRKAIPVSKRVAVALYALGCSAEYRTISTLFGVGRTTVGEIVLEFCCAIYATWRGRHLNSYPMDQGRLDEIVKGFEELGYPQCIGAIDGCHIEVCPSEEDAIDYENAKGWHSIILLAVVDHRHRFTYISAGSPGSNSESYTYEVSKLRRYSQTNDLFERNAKAIDGVLIPVHYIGDSAFKLEKNLMKPYPFRTNQSPQEKLFNSKLAKCRLVAETAFGDLKKRFRRIGGCIKVNTKNVSKVVLACCVLHNFLCSENDAIPDHWEECNSNRQQPIQRKKDRDQNAGRSIRDALAEYFYHTDKCPELSEDVDDCENVYDDVSSSGDDDESDEELSSREDI